MPLTPAAAHPSRPPARRARGWLFWSLLAAFAAACALWIFHVPYGETELLRAVPENAIFVSEHDRLAQRWPQVAANPLVAAALEQAGVPADAATNLLADARFAQTLHALGAGTTIAAYCPALGPSGQPAWLAASRLGPEAQFLRWGVISDDKLGLRSVPIAEGTKAWLAPLEGDPGGRVVGLAVVEGMLVAALSRDPLAVRTLVERVRGKAPVMPLLAELAGSGAPTAPDRAWLLTAAFGGAGQAMQWAAETLDGNTAAGWVRLPLEGEGALAALDRYVRAAGARVDGGGEAALAEVRAMLNAPPDAFLQTAYGWARPLMAGAAAGGFWATLRAELDAAAPEETPAFAAVLSGECAGRVLGLRVPTLLVGLRVGGGTDPLAGVDQAMDRINAATGWGLVPRRVQTGGRPAIVIETTRPGVVASLRPEERPALTVAGDWLIAASNLASLDRALRSPAVPAGAPVAGCFRTAMPAGRGDDRAALRLWVDAAAVGAAVRNIVAVYSLVLLVRNGGGASPAAERLEQTRRVAEMLQCMHAGALRAGVGPRDVRVDVRLER